MSHYNKHIITAQFEGVEGAGCEREGDGRTGGISRRGRRNGLYN